MKKLFTLATALMLLAGTTKAAKNDIDVKASNTPSTDAKPITPAMAATATTVSMADVMKENQQLKLALAKITSEKEALESKVDFQHNMHFATVSLYEAQLQDKDEDSKSQSGFAWMMHNVIVTLTNALNSAK